VVLIVEFVRPAQRLLIPNRLFGLRFENTFGVFRRTARRRLPTTAFVGLLSKRVMVVRSAIVIHKANASATCSLRFTHWLHHVLVLIPAEPALGGSLVDLSRALELRQVPVGERTYLAHPTPHPASPDVAKIKITCAHTRTQARVHTHRGVPIKDSVHKGLGLVKSILVIFVLDVHVNGSRWHH
jgi:hypothetical protein